MLTEMISLFKKEVLLEWRRKYAFNGILLYLTSTIFVCYFSFKLQHQSLNPISWNALFWIILLFTAVNTIAKSFIQESEGRQIYYYQLATPEAIIFSKICYNSVLMLLMGLLALLVYSIVLGNPVQNLGLFIANLSLGSLCFASNLTMVSAIAAKSGNNATLMAVLIFPVILPVLLLLIKVSKNAIDDLALSSSYDELSVIAALNLIVLTVSYILFPYLWRA